MAAGTDDVVRIDARAPESGAAPDGFEATVTEDGEIDGVLVSVGGPGEWVPVRLADGVGRVTEVLARPEIARKLAEHIRGAPVRVFGQGRWVRGASGGWLLDRFQAERFDVLDTAKLRDVVADLRAVPGSEWPDIADPWAELDLIRNG